MRDVVGILSCNIVASIATTSEINSLRFSRRKPLSLLKHVFELTKPYYERSHIKEKSAQYDKNILNVSPHVYLEGHWNSEKYFIKIESRIRKEFTLRSAMSVKANLINESINKVNSVSLHIRRGDYADNDKINSVHGTMEIDYYTNAVDRISQAIPSPNFFIFSDDPKWAKEHLDIPYPMTVVSGNEIPDHEELILMSKCKHHITANSSFSWWGAWLGAYSNKIVITPKTWFRDEVRNSNDRLPLSWIQT